MKKLICLVDSLRDLLNPLRKSFREVNKELSDHEGMIIDKDIKYEARKARLKLKEALKEYNLIMDHLTCNSPRKVGRRMMKNVADIVEKNGKTVRENNLSEKHKIPLGTLVEVDIGQSSHKGVRLYVCAHNRDCDGSPLYTLGIPGEEYFRTGGYGEESLKVIFKPSGKP